MSKLQFHCLCEVAGEIYVLVCTLDYSGAGEIEDAGPLTSSTDAKRFLNLVKSCGVPEENIVVRPLPDSPGAVLCCDRQTNIDRIVARFSHHFRIERIPSDCTSLRNHDQHRRPSFGLALQDL